MGDTVEWCHYFESNIRQDFQELWKAVPEGYSKIRVLFEVRYDDKEAGLPAEADVYLRRSLHGSGRRQHALKGFTALD